MIFLFLLIHIFSSRNYISNFGGKSNFFAIQLFLLAIKNACVIKCVFVAMLLCNKLLSSSYYVYTISENIIGTPKILNNFWCHTKMLNFPMLRQPYWLLYCSPFIYRFSNFAIAKVVSLKLFASFLYRFCRLFHGFMAQKSLCYSSNDIYHFSNSRAINFERAIEKKEKKFY